jgi:phosphotransferase system IIA component
MYEDWEGGLYTFTREDPSNGADPISCSISNIEPTTNIFYLNGKGSYEILLKVALNTITLTLKVST